MNIEERIGRAINLIQNGWTKHELARDDKEQPVSPFAAIARKWCLIGALARASGIQDYSVDPQHRKVIRILRHLIGKEMEYVFEWNDHGERTQRDVLILLRKALVKAKEKAHVS